MSRGPRGIREEPVPRSGQTHVQILVWELVVQGATLEEPLGLADLTCKWGYPAFSAPAPELLPVEATSPQGSAQSRPRPVEAPPPHLRSFSVTFSSSSCARRSSISKKWRVESNSFSSFSSRCVV